MINLTSPRAIAALYQDSTIPGSCLDFLNDHLHQIQSSCEDDDSLAFLSHSFSLLESADLLTPDPEQNMVFSCAAGMYWPEYIECYIFNDGCSLYKIFALLDNESSITFFTLQGIHSLEAEYWLHEHATIYNL